MKIHFKKGQVIGNWVLQSYLGGGGNGEVWNCHNEQVEIRAIKILKNVREKSYNRFRDETFIVENNVDIEGILPLHDKFLPDQFKGKIPFYVMPVAEPSEKKLNGQPIEEKVHAILEVATTILELHKRGISHRDIKPANILYYNFRFVLADFGLVDYPDKKDVSFPNEGIGPKWTMAPEMRRESSDANSQKADVYSLAKTLWIFLTGRQKGFDGQYSTDSIIELRKFYRNSFTSPIDNLLTLCTDNDPAIRPTITQFIDSLKEWEKLAANFHGKIRRQWFEIQTKLFPASLPRRVRSSSFFI